MDEESEYSEENYPTNLPESGGKKKPKSEDLIIEAKNFFNFNKEDLGESIRKRTNTIFLDFMKLTEFSNKLSDEIIINPEETLSIIEQAVEELGLVKNVRIRLKNLSDAHQLKIRNIRSKHLNELIMLEGIIRQASDVRPQVVNAKFECPSCGTVISVLQIEKKFREPSRCSCGRRGGFRLMSKDMVDTQRLVVEESPESLSGGEQPKRMNVFVKEDLVEPKMEEKTTPGARIKIIGILKEVPVPLSTGGLSTRFELAVEANNIIPLEETFEELDITDEDERQIQELSEDPKIYDNLAKSIAPSIWGYEEIKKSLVLQLFGGVQKQMSDGSKSRGDIHILLIGDPGVAKSIGKDERVMFFSDKDAGYYSIENLYKKFGKNPEDLNVLTINQKSHESKWEKVCEIIKHLPEKELIRVKTEHGKNIVATKDHSFIILSKKGEIIPIKGETLTKDTYLPIPINYHKELFKFFTIGDFNKKNTSSKLLPEKIPLDKDFGFFMGIFLSEGYIKNGKTIEISNKNKEIQKRIISFTKKIGLNYQDNEKSVSVFSKNLSDILKTYCYSKKDLDELIKGTKGNYSRIKKIPELSYFAPKEFIYGLVSGLFSGDGRLIKDTKMLKGFELITISKQLAEGTSDLLFSIGIINKIKKREYTYNQKKTDYYSVTIPTYMIKDFVKNIEFLGRDIKLNEKDPIYSYNNLIPCGDLVYEIVKKLNYNSRKTGNRTLAAEMRTVKKRGVIGRLRLLKLINNFEERTKEKIGELETLKKIASSNIVWSKINDVELLKKKDEEVYDLSIPSTNTFVSNGIGLHNSVTLGFMAKISPKGRYVVGKSTSGAGLTATVVRDEYLKGWSLEAGAMVLANRGLICIDELEKMDPQDRSAMHEAMEQQTVTISKANVQATLKAQTSVLAAANPKFGRFDPFMPIPQQIDLPPTLINRFDIIFTLRDIPDRIKDERIATHVLKEHQKETKDLLIDSNLFRKYVAYAKQKINPKLGSEAVEEIKKFYIELRNKPVVSESAMRPIPISARQLQALIRMAEASAKMRLSEIVSKEDAKRAIELMTYYLMQVGYDYESKTFDIDKISGKFSSSQRNKILMVKETITALESRMGKMIPYEEIEKELEDKMRKDELEEVMNRLIKDNEIYRPKKGYIGVF